MVTMVGHRLLLVVLSLVLASCLGIKKSRFKVWSDLITADLNSLVQQSGTPILVAFSPPAGGSLLDPDPERTDPRYLLSSQELQYVTQYEIQLRESGYLETQSLHRARDEMQVALKFVPPTQDDLDMYVDEVELGIPHKPRALSQAEVQDQERQIHARIETFFLQVLSELQPRTNDELQIMLLNISANLRLQQILLERSQPQGLSEISMRKHLEMTAYLRRRLIQVMLERGIR